MRRVLYLGIEVPQRFEAPGLIHYPIIKIVPRPMDTRLLRDFFFVTHLIFTSKPAVQVFSNYGLQVQEKQIIAVGTATASRLAECGMSVAVIAKEETAEGVVAELDKLSLRDAFVLWPHSALARPVISDYLVKRGVKHLELPIYDTLPNLELPLPKLNEIDEIVFTSPSTIDVFLMAYGTIPTNKIFTCIGPVTEKHLSEVAKAT